MFVEGVRLLDEALVSPQGPPEHCGRNRGGGGAAPGTGSRRSIAGERGPDRPRVPGVVRLDFASPFASRNRRRCGPGRRRRGGALGRRGRPDPRSRWRAGPGKRRHDLAGGGGGGRLLGLADGGAVDRTNPKLIRASAGSLFRLKPSRLPPGAVKHFRAAGGGGSSRRWPRAVNLQSASHWESRSSSFSARKGGA